MVGNRSAGAESELLSDEEVGFFDDRGYLILRNRIPQGLVIALQEASSYWIELGRNSDSSLPGHKDWLFTDRPSGRVMFRVEHILDKGHPAGFELLGASAILGIAESLAGPNFVPTYESLVFKKAEDAVPIAWHQDLVHERRDRIFNIGVYLDSSRAGAGALRVLPSSQTNRGALPLEDASWDRDDAIEVEMEAGDVLVHDVMIVHGSPPASGNALRRTIYLEFRGADAIARELPWGIQYARQRMSLLNCAIALHARRFPLEPQYAWHPDGRYLERELGPSPGELAIMGLGW